MTSPEELEEIRRIGRELREEFPMHVLNQIDRVAQELDVLRNRVTQLIKLLENKNVRRECLHESDYY